MPCRRTPTGHGQPFALVSRHVTELLAYQLMSMKVMVLLDQSIIPATFLRPNRPDHQMIQNVLFIGVGPAEFGLGHVPSLKNLLSDVPYKMANLSASVL